MIRPQLAEFMKRIGDDSIAIIPSAREVMRSNDSNFRFRQDSDFYYLTGFEEPEAIAVIRPSDKEHPYTLFVRPRDPEKEVWDGKRSGVEGAIGEYGADTAFPIEEFGEKLEDLINGASSLFYRIGNGNADIDDLIISRIHKMRAKGRKNINPPGAIVDIGSIVHEMRLIKTEEEIELMQRAADIAAEGHIEAMKAVRPGMKEYEIEALIEHIFRRNGAAAPAYTSIVGSGANATVLHYVSNDATLKDGDLLLIDAGAEYRGYASDITRTFPINGKFSEAQREVYEVVLEAQMACIEMVRVGNTNDDMKQRSIEIQTEGMVRLGILQGDVAKLIEEEKYKQFYMHGLGHYLGLDVHDVGRYYIKEEPRKLEAGMVMTVEPGIYIAPDTKDIPEKYLGIGVRIEDDVLVTDGDPRVLSSKAPKQVEEIEELMAGYRV